MATWENLFSEGKLVAHAPQAEVLQFASHLESVFSDRPLRIWDLCCGAGRHAQALAGMGHRVYASDAAPSGMELTRKRLAEHGLTAELAVADMTVCPWPEVRFHGVVSWDSLHHNRLDAIRESVSVVRPRLLPGGLFLASLKSTKADSYGMGEELEPDTFVRADGHEAGVAHHFFDETGIRELFEGWEILVLTERIMDYRVRGPDFYELNPFGYTCWGVVARMSHRSSPR